MQPEPVPRSRTLLRLLPLDAFLSSSASRIVQSSVSGRGMRTGGRVKSVRDPKGCVPAERAGSLN